MRAEPTSSGNGLVPEQNFAWINVYLIFSRLRNDIIIQGDFQENQQNWSA